MKRHGGGKTRGLIQWQLLSVEEREAWLLGAAIGIGEMLVEGGVELLCRMAPEALILLHFTTDPDLVMPELTCPLFNEFTTRREYAPRVLASVRAWLEDGEIPVVAQDRRGLTAVTSIPRPSP